MIKIPDNPDPIGHPVGHRDDRPLALREDRRDARPQAHPGDHRAGRRVRRSIHNVRYSGEIFTHLPLADPVFVPVGILPLRLSRGTTCGGSSSRRT